MRFIEIRLSNGLLLVGSPGAFPGVMNKAADQQQLRSVLRSFPRNSAAMGQLRRQWRRLYPAQSSTTLPAQEMVRLLGRELAAARLAAAFLRDAPCNIGETKFNLGTGQVVHVPMAGFTLLIASKGQLPPEFNRYRNNRGGAAMLRQIAQNDPSAAAIDNQAARLPGGTVKRITGLPLRQHLAWAIESGAHECAILEHRIPISQAAARPDAPRDVMSMSSAEKIGEAMSRSCKYLRGDVLAAVEAMVEPEALVIMAGVFAAVALAQLNPVSGAAVDTAIVALAWYSAGLAGVLALSDFVDATITATGAASEAELNEAAKSYSKAFVALGAMLLEALMAKFLAKKGGKSAKEGGGSGSGGNKAQRQAEPARNPQPNAAKNTPPPSTGSPPPKRPPAKFIRPQHFYDDLAKAATRNPDSKRLVLGKFNEGGKSYTKVASHYEATYFKLEKWRETTKDMSPDEIWKINESFLKQQIKQGKEIVLSHDPAKATGFYNREVEFLKALGYKFEQSDWVWKAVR